MEILQRHGYEVLERVHATDGCVVFRGRHPGCPNCTPLVALKVHTFTNAAAANLIMREIENQSAFQNHPNVVRLFEYFSEVHSDGKYSVCLVVEWMTNDLMKEVQQRYRHQFLWSETELMNIASTLVQVLADAERMHICHRDIKPQNVFLDTASQSVKLGDFGSSASGVASGVQEATLRGSPQFMSKELREGICMKARRISHDVVKSDVYALGMTLITLALLEVPILLAKQQNSDSIVQTLWQIQYSDYVKGMLWDMLNPDVDQRLTFVQLQEKYQIEQRNPLSSSPTEVSLPSQSLSKQVMPQQYLQTEIERETSGVEAGQWYSYTYYVKNAQSEHERIQSQYSAWDFSASQQALQQPSLCTEMQKEQYQNEYYAAQQYQRECEAAEQYQRDYEAAQQLQRDYEAAQQLQRDYEAAQQLQRDFEAAQQLQRDFEAAQQSQIEIYSKCQFPNEYYPEQASQNPAEQRPQQIGQHNPSQRSANYGQEPRASAAMSGQPEQKAPNAFMEQWPPSAIQFDQSSVVRKYRNSYLPECQSQQAVASSNPQPASNARFESSPRKMEQPSISQSIRPQSFRQCSREVPSPNQYSRDKCILCDESLTKIRDVIHLNCSECDGMKFCCSQHFETYVESETIRYSKMELTCCFCNTLVYWGNIEEAFGGEKQMHKKMKKALKHPVLCRLCNKKPAERILECSDALCSDCFTPAFIGSNVDCPLCGFKSPICEKINSNPVWKLAKGIRKFFQLS